MTKVVKRGPGRPKGSKNKTKTDVTVVKRGRGRPKGSKNKVKSSDTPSTKRGRGRPKGSKNKSTVSLEPNLEEVMDIPFPNPIHESQRIENIRHMVSFYQHPDGRKKVAISTPKKRGRKSELENFDPEKLLKEDLDSDKLVYKQSDVDEELNRMDAYRDMTINKDRY
tara:strand:+ start:637 stop:1137 length:501 start_codon:yes stop_codon:yes gene_type:complete